MPVKIEGMIPPIVVPFTAKGGVDEAAFRGDLRYLVSKGVDGFSSGGSTGEGAVLSDSELVRCLEIVMEEKPKGMPIVAGVIRNSTQDVIKCALDAKRLGADAILVTPVSYFGSTFEGNYGFFKDIAKAVKLPIIIYNVVPTNIIGQEDFLKLLEIDEVFGIKQVDPVRHAETSALCLSVKKARVFSACDQMLYGTYVSGSAGAISALVTIAPELCVKQWKAFKAGDQKTAMEIQQKLVPIVRTYLLRPFPGRVKELLNLQGRNVGKGRLPNIMPSKKEREEMVKALKGAGLV
jgi:4-hydroxy-tetrahydrodipicolinate synthase